MSGERMGRGEGPSLIWEGFLALVLLLHSSRRRLGQGLHPSHRLVIFVSERSGTWRTIVVAV